MLTFLEPEIGVCQILIQFGAEGLFLIARIQTGVGHCNEPSLPILSFVLANLLWLAPDWRFMLTQNLVLGYNTPVFKNEISPHESPSHLFHDAGCRTTARREGNNLGFFRRPFPKNIRLLLRESHQQLPELL